MSRTLADIFNDNPGVEIIEVVGYDDGGPFGLSSGGRKLKILDDNFARQLVALQGTDTEAGHLTEESYYIYAHENRYDIHNNLHKSKVYVYRLSPEQRSIE